ncbi:hypothetical protein H8M03_01560 [Sphingomonas sabuli]|uniref:Sulfotransferase family protein n=1 Tax=Sphingomonas sabuli TaxID=2764186 RepID=A0A7G9L378_9SPHN|nr:sulfotransferase family 2 domain-containing protein [Sphingomonas sabuli]QNM83077.1 hypothetical protein H8M03_01560 [Sphingomonas sabuli]
MISHEYRCIFIHQRKCAGTSIIRAFGIEPPSPDSHYGNDGALGRDVQDWPDGYRVFSVVRNPWDRFVSGWKYLPTLRDKSLREVLADLPTEGHDYRHLTRPQSAILFDDSGRPVFHELLRFETLQADFDRLCDRLGKPRTALPRAKASKHDDYRTYYDERTRDAVGDLFLQDVVNFDYAFEG